MIHYVLVLKIRKYTLLGRTIVIKTKNKKLLQCLRNVQVPFILYSGIFYFRFKKRLVLS